MSQPALREDVVPELLRPFARLHVVGLVLIGCLALWVLTGRSLWMWVGVGSAAVGCLWAAFLLYRDLRRTRT